MFTYKRRVKFYETDGMRVVHHANYLRYFEEARVEYLRAGGIDLNDLMKEGIVFPILEIKSPLQVIDLQILGSFPQNFFTQLIQVFQQLASPVFHTAERHAQPRGV